MNVSNPKPIIFIAASTAANELATGVQGHLEKDFTLRICGG